MTGWRKRQVIDMAREVNAVFDVMAMGRHDGILFTPLELEAFAELVRADERNRTWTQEHWTEYERNIAATERELCAKVCEDIEALSEGGDDQPAYRYYEAIRARGE